MRDPRAGDFHVEDKSDEDPLNHVVEKQAAVSLGKRRMPEPNVLQKDEACFAALDGVPDLRARKLVPGSYLCDWVALTSRPRRGSCKISTHSADPQLEREDRRTEER